MMIGKILLAGAIALTLAFPVWAAEEKKAEDKTSQPGKMEKAEKKPAKGNENVMKVQQALKDKGQDPGPIDGMMGSKTKAAVKAFQEANGMKGTGKLDKETADKLGVEMAKGPSKKAGGESKDSKDKAGAKSDAGGMKEEKK